VLEFVKFLKKIGALADKIQGRYISLDNKLIGAFWENAMEALTSIVSNVNWEAIVQLTLLAAIMLAGPIVIAVLAFRGGDL
jgi:hypothetical protein